MPAWPGGPCPDCGEEMPPNLLRCQTCRAWLNPDLTRPEPTAPESFLLPEIDPHAGATDAEQPVAAAGHYVICPACRRELRIAARYVGASVACKYCDEPFVVDVRPDAEPPRIAFYLNCPHCTKEIRASNRYAGQRVVCKHCDGSLTIARGEG